MLFNILTNLYQSNRFDWLRKRTFWPICYCNFYHFLSMGLIADCKLESSVHFIADPNYYPPPNEQNVKSYIAHAGMI